MSECALKYALACIDPFAPGAFGVCNPAGKETFTEKRHSLQRITGSIGSSGTGFVMVSPSLANDADNVFYTTSAFTDTVAKPCTANNVLAVGVATQTPGQLPYSTSTLANSSKYASESVTGRVVAVGLRITYTGTTVNESGMIYGLHDPAHMSISGAGQGDIGTYAEAVVRPVSRKACTISAFALDDAEDQMLWQTAGIATPTNLLYPFNPVGSLNVSYKGTTSYTYAGAGGANVGGPVLGFVFSGVAGMSFQIEIVQHVEYVGQTCQSAITRSHVDPVGAVQVKNAVRDAQLIANQRPVMDTTDPWVDFKRSIAHTAADLVKKKVSSYATDAFHALMA